MRKDKINMITAVIIILLFGFTMLKNIVFNINYFNFILNFVITFLFFTLNLKAFRKKSSFSKVINCVLITNSLLTLVFNSYNGTGFLLLYAFILLITFACMIKTKLRFEISLVVSVSILIFSFIVLGLLNILSFSLLFLLIVSLALIYYIYRNNNLFFKNL